MHANTTLSPVVVNIGPIHVGDMMAMTKNNNNNNNYNNITNRAIK